MANYYVNIVGTNEYPFDTPEKGATNFDMLFGGWTKRYTQPYTMFDICMSESGEHQAAINTGNEIYLSHDYGKTWSINYVGSNLRAISMSADGSRITAVTYFDYIYVSIDYGFSFTSKSSVLAYVNVAMSSTGQYQIASTWAFSGGKVYFSSDYGETWLDKTPFSLVLDWKGVTISSDGSKLTVAAAYEYIYISSDYGATWTQKANSREWESVVMSANGEIQTAVARNDFIYVSVDYGDTWNPKGSYELWYRNAMSSDGSIQMAVIDNGFLYKSIDYGETWIINQDYKTWQGVALSSNGLKSSAVCYNGSYFDTSTIYEFNTIGDVVFVDGDIIEVVWGSIEFDERFSTFIINKSIIIRSWSGNTERPSILAKSQGDLFQIINAGSVQIENVGMIKASAPTSGSFISFLSGSEDDVRISGCNMMIQDQWMMMNVSCINISGSTFNSLIIENNTFLSTSFAISSDTSISNLTIQRNVFSYLFDTAINFNLDVQDTIISKNIFQGSNIGIRFMNNVQNVIIQKNYFDSQYGFSIYSNASLFQNNLIKNNQFSYCNVMVLSNSVINCDIVNNTMMTVTIGMILSELTNTNIVNNIIYGGDYEQIVGIQTDNYISGTLDYNCVFAFANNFNIVGTVTPGIHNIIANPKIYNRRNTNSQYSFDYMLFNSSPCLDAGAGAGTISSVPLDDFRDGVRPISLSGFIHVDDGTDIGAFEMTEREAGLLPQSFFVNAGGSSTEPFDTPEKGSLTIENIAWQHKELVWPGDIFEIVDNGTVVETFPAPYEIQRGSIIRSWSGNRSKPIVQLQKTATTFHAGKILNIKFVKDGDIMLPGPIVANFFASLYKDDNQEVSGCEFKIINAPTDMMYVIGVPALQYGGNGVKIINNVFVNCYPAIALLNNSLNSVIVNNTIYRANIYSLPFNVVINVDNTGDSCNGTVILNNIIYCDVNVGTAININDVNLTQDYNNIHGVGVEYSGVAISGAHNIDSINSFGHTNPGFVGNSTELFIASPCVNSGAIKTDYPQLPEFDFDGTLRPDITPMSIGAYEPKIKAYFRKNSSTQLTTDTDDNRINSDMCAVVSPEGQRILFYAKTFNSGRLSNSRVTYTIPFTLNIQAGNGIINGIAVSWGATSLIAGSNSFILIYVDNLGTVGMTTDFTMTFMKDVIVLAYVNTGNSEIVYVEEVEKISKNIYCRKQVSYSYGSWSWDDYELILNTGEQPRAFYNSDNNKIYMSYKKDDIAFVRIFDLNSQISFSYLPNKYISSDVIYLNRNPESSLYFSGSMGSISDNDIASVDLFPLGPSALSFMTSQAVMSASVPAPAPA